MKRYLIITILASFLIHGVSAATRDKALSQFIRVAEQLGDQASIGTIIRRFDEMAGRKLVHEGKEVGVGEFLMARGVFGTMADTAIGDVGNVATAKAAIYALSRMSHNPKIADVLTDTTKTEEFGRKLFNAIGAADKNPTLASRSFRDKGLDAIAISNIINRGKAVKHVKVEPEDYDMFEFLDDIEAMGDKIGMTFRSVPTSPGNNFGKNGLVGLLQAIDNNNRYVNVSKGYLAELRTARYCQDVLGYEVVELSVNVVAGGFGKTDIDVLVRIAGNLVPIQVKYTENAVNKYERLIRWGRISLTSTGSNPVVARGKKGFVLNNIILSYPANKEFPLSFVEKYGNDIEDAGLGLVGFSTMSDSQKLSLFTQFVESNNLVIRPPM